MQPLLSIILARVIEWRFYLKLLWKQYERFLEGFTENIISNAVKKHEVVNTTQCYIKEMKKDNI